ncbi:DUF2993 domain-containing protein [Blastococcus montanus]|uniref:LmeA family phospholipid-binding protein n=1 Tax=Blastococcus montanus TaxID=3144973 RepID=UPI00320AF82A
MGTRAGRRVLGLALGLLLGAAALLWAAGARPSRGTGAGGGRPAVEPADHSTRSLASAPARPPAPAPAAATAGRADTGRPADPVAGPADPGTGGQGRPGPAEPGGRRRRRGPETRTVVLALGVLLTTAALLWAADLLARRAAEGLVAQALQEQTGTFERPTVQVRGAFFLPQVLRGRYEEVDIAMEGLVSGPLRIDSVRAELDDVYLSFHDLLHGETDEVVIRYTEAEALLTYDDLNEYLDLTGRPLTLAEADDGELMVNGSVDVLGATLEASADADIGSEDGELVVQPTRFGGIEGLDRVSELLLDQRFTFRVPLDPLPFAQRVTDIGLVDAGVVVDVAGEWVVLDP